MSSSKRVPYPPNQEGVLNRITALLIKATRTTSRICAMIGLIRPHNCISAFASVVLGIQLAAGPCTTIRLVLAGTTAFLLVGAGNAANDYFDVEFDRINRPTRALPSGRISRKTAFGLAIVLSLLGLGLAFLVSYEALILVCLVVVLSYVYSWKLKKVAVAGNTVISLLCAMTVIYGGIVVGHIRPTVLPAIIIFLFMLWREMVKTVDDYEGDLREGARTLAIVIGKHRTLNLSCCLAVLAMAVSAVPYLVNTQPAANPFIMLLVVYPTMIVSAAVLLWQPTERNIKRMLKATKLVFFVWLIAMFLR